MTVFEASVKLYEWFSENDSFSLKKDFTSLTGKQLKLKSAVAAVKCGLKDLTDMSMVASAEVDGEETWVLKKNYHTLEQTVSLSAETCNSISHIVTAFCDIIGNEKEKPDPTSIQEQDIKNLMFVCTHLMDNKSDSIEEE
tara:strand:- start:3033 stop:3452 length:420 start_codon:yes stop_codon:yes gene_type:complete